MTKNKTVLKLGLPKGSLEQATLEKMGKAGFNISVSERSYVPYVDDAELEIRLIRAQEVSRYVEHGYLDCGITGHDWIQENGSNVHEVGEFLFSKATRQPTRWVLAVPEKSPVRSVRDLKCKRGKIEIMALLLKGALEAETKVGVKMNIEEKNLAQLLNSLPALRNPTVSNLSQSGWVAVETIIDQHIVRELIPQLKAAGAE